MDPLTIALIASGVSAGSKLIQGVKQKRAAKKINVGEREIPEETMRALQDVKTRATSGKYAGQDAAESLQEASVANILGKTQDLSSPGARAAQLANAMSTLSRGKLESSIYGAQDRRQRQAAADSARMEMGQMQRNIQEANIQDAARAKSALQAAGQQNVTGAISDLAGSAATALGAGLGAGKNKDTFGGGEDSSAFNKSSSQSPTNSPQAGLVTREQYAAMGSEERRAYDAMVSGRGVKFLD